MRNKKLTDQIQEIYKHNPNAPELNLEFWKIGSLTHYLPLLKQFTMLKKLSLHNNGLKDLPPDLSMFVGLVQLDISNNIFADVDAVIQSLRTLPSLKYLHINVKKSQEKKLIQHLPKLIELNNRKIFRQTKSKQYVFKVLNIENLNNFASKIKEKFQQLLELENIYLHENIHNDNQNQIFFFEQDLQSISTEILNKLDNVKDQISQTLQMLLFQNAKYQMYEQIQNKYLSICTDVYGDLGASFKNIIIEQNLILKVVLQKAYNLCQLQYEMKQAEIERKNQIFSDPEEIFYNRMLLLEKQLKRKKKVIEQLKEQNRYLEGNNSKLLKTIKNFSNLKNSTFQNSSILLQNNIVQKIFEYLPQRSIQKSPNQQPLRSIRKSLDQRPQASVKKSPNQRPQVNLQKSPNQRPQKNIKKSHNQSTRRMSEIVKSPMTSIDNNVKQHVRRESMTNNALANNNRSLTLKQLKQSIQEIYESKIRYDRHNFDGKLPQQTMHQYLFTHLNQKYGLKSLTIQAAKSIVLGIQTFSKEDNEIVVFGKILRNEVDEEFRFVQSQLKTSILQKLKAHIATKNPYKNSQQINQIFMNKINKQITMEQCQDIINYLYNSYDANQIIKSIKSHEFKQNKMRTQERKRRTSSKSQYLIPQKIKTGLSFQTFLQIVLSYQLRIHEKLLRPLIKTFKNLDKNKLGILNEDRFILLLEKLCDEEANELIPQFMQIIDPYSTKSYTFSQIVKLLSNYPKQQPILSRFNEQNQSQQDEEQDIQRKSIID